MVRLTLTINTKRSRSVNHYIHKIKRRQRACIFKFYFISEFVCESLDVLVKFRFSAIFY